MQIGFYNVPFWFTWLLNYLIDSICEDDAWHFISRTYKRKEIWYGMRLIIHETRDSPMILAFEASCTQQRIKTLQSPECDMISWWDCAVNTACFRKYLIIGIIFFKQGIVNNRNLIDINRPGYLSKLFRI